MMYDPPSSTGTRSRCMKKRTAWALTSERKISGFRRFVLVWNSTRVA